MHEFQILTEATEAMKATQSALTEKMSTIFRVGATEIVVDGAGRRMAVEICAIETGDQAGYLRVMPINGKRTRSCIRSVHWSQIHREEPDNAY